ncbi:kinase [Bacillus sp. KH172YL63]|uniref:kinase n=1 Tax=Bacillus sp. KH172YL63 TaxID=2709784 RepID=UPI0015666973|nr:kinase [Bacillus sp. KH172YL63]
MKSTLIILRGNSASGKTTIANRLQEHYGHGTLLVSQDTVRRNMLKVHDRDGNLSIELIRQITEYGKGKCEVVILEGILSSARYGDMLKDLIEYFNGRALVYYFDLTFEETLRRHRTKGADFGEELLARWWIPKDFLGVQGETAIGAELSEDEVLDRIVKKVEAAQGDCI